MPLPRIVRVIVDGWTYAQRDSNNFAEARGLLSDAFASDSWPSGKATFAIPVRSWPSLKPTAGVSVHLPVNWRSIACAAAWAASTAPSCQPGSAVT